ncbi:MAG: hypothetical protein AB3N64_00685 [Puniceicoccaceae bacterium]
MKLRLFTIIILVFSVLAAGSAAFGAKGGIPGKPDKPGDEEDPPPTPIEGYYFWRLGHMDGPHTSSIALGISRDGKTAVGTTQVVDFYRAWRLDIDWAIATDDGIPPLYNELQVQEDVGLVQPSQPSAAFAASDMTYVPTYDKVNLVLDWGGSFPVGTYSVGQVSYAIQWLLPVLDRVGEEFVPGTDFYAISDYGGGISEMVATDVSFDGQIIVGTGNTMTGPVAFRADTLVVDEDLVPIPVQLTITDFSTDDSGQTLQSSSAEAVSADGLTIAGYGATKTGNKAFVTTFLGVDETTGEALLESYLLPALAGGQWCEAYALTETDDILGFVIAGRSDSPKGPQACIWFMGDDPETAETEVYVVRGIGGLSKKKYDSVASSICYRPGSTAGDLMVVGASQTIRYPSEAFVWTGNAVLEPDGPYTLPDGGENEYIGYMYDLEKILIKTGAGEASLMGSSWVLKEATGVSAAGDRIVGYGTNPERGEEAWLVTNYPYNDLEFTHD